MKVSRHWAYLGSESCYRFDLIFLFLLSTTPVILGTNYNGKLSYQKSSTTIDKAEEQARGAKLQHLETKFVRAVMAMKVAEEANQRQRRQERPNSCRFPEIPAASSSRASSSPALVSEEFSATAHRIARQQQLNLGVPLSFMDNHRLSLLSGGQMPPVNASAGLMAAGGGNQLQRSHPYHHNNPGASAELERAIFLLQLERMQAAQPPLGLPSLAMHRAQMFQSLSSGGGGAGSPRLTGLGFPQGNSRGEGADHGAQNFSPTELMLLRSMNNQNTRPIMTSSAAAGVMSNSSGVLIDAALRIQVEGQRNKRQWEEEEAFGCNKQGPLKKRK
jgi:hypothetical protein